jgi:hypothetical protein
MRRQRPDPITALTFTVWRMALSGFCASLIGIGISRFACRPSDFEARGLN